MKKKKSANGIGRAGEEGLPKKAWKLRKLFRVRFRYTAPKARLTRRKPYPKTVASLPKPFRNVFRTSFGATPTDRPREKTL